MREWDVGCEGLGLGLQQLGDEICDKLLRSGIKRADLRD